MSAKYETPGLSTRDPHLELVRARQAHRDVLEALELPEHICVALRAAASAWAKAAAVAATTSYIDARKLRSDCGINKGEAASPFCGAISEAGQ